MSNIYNLAFANINGVGPVIAKAIMEVFPSTEALFSENRKALEAVFGKREKIINDILNKTMFAKCEKELEFIEKYNIKLYFFKDKDYPYKLLQIPDLPICLFYQGNMDLNMDRMVAVVGTRNSTEYGREVTGEIISELRAYNVGVVSGLAYGIDSIAHQKSLEEGIPTFGVLGHGLDIIYPNQNFDLSQSMLNNGGLITEYMTQTRPIPQDFPKRNRIIAGLCDAVICVEAAKKGGALLTADLANQYNREVFAVPGRLKDTYSEGCNYLIQTQRANILHRFSDIPTIMNWEPGTQLELFKETRSSKISLLISKLPKPERQIYDYIYEKKEASVDEISIDCSKSLPILAGILLSLELEGLVRCLPGKVYKVIK